MDKAEIIIYISSSIIGGLVVFCGWMLTVGRKFQILDVLQEGLKELKQDFKDLRDRIENCIERITALEVRYSLYTKSGSPIKLTEIGQKVLDASRAKEVLDSNIEFLLGELEKKMPKSALDVQRLASVVLYEQENQDFMKPLKDFVYQNSRFENNDFAYSDMIGVCAIYLRDKYLKKNPEFLSGQ